MSTFVGIFALNTLQTLIEHRLQRIYEGAHLFAHIYPSNDRVFTKVLKSLPRGHLLLKRVVLAADCIECGAA